MNLGLLIIVELILVALLADFPFTCISAECRLVEAFVSLSGRFEKGAQPTSALLYSWLFQRVHDGDS